MKAIEPTTRKRFRNADHEASVQTKCDNLLSGIKLKGEEYGRNGLPLLKGDSMKLYFAPFFYEYQAMLDSNNTEHQCEVTCFEACESDQLADRGISNLEHELADTEHELIPVESELKNTPMPRKRSSAAIGRVCMVVVGCLDTLLNTHYFEMLGFDYLTSFGIGVSFAAVLLIFSHFVPRVIKLGSTQLQRRLIAGGIALFMGMLFWHLAALRAAFANAATGSHQSPVFFTAFSLFLFSVAVCIYLFQMPSEKDREAIERYNTLLARSKSLNGAIESIGKRLATARATKSEFRVDNSSIILLGGMLEKQIITNAHRGFAELKAAMLRFRNERPECLDNEFPFMFHRYFTQID